MHPYQLMYVSLRYGWTACTKVYHSELAPVECVVCWVGMHASWVIKPQLEISHTIYTLLIIQHCKREVHLWDQLQYFWSLLVLFWICIPSSLVPWREEATFLTSLRFWCDRWRLSCSFTHGDLQHSACFEAACPWAWSKIRSAHQQDSKGSESLQCRVIHTADIPCCIHWRAPDSLFWREYGGISKSFQHWWCLLSIEFLLGLP